jgi:ankyrin repeat protein
MACQGIDLPFLTGSIKTIDKEVATLGIPTEKTMARAKDHFKICQFSDEDDQLKVLDERLCDLFNGRAFDCYRTEYLRLLRALTPSLVGGDHFRQFDTMEDSVDWVLGHENYKSWLNSTTPAVLHLSGVRGIGKSAMSHFLVEALRSGEGHDKIAVASFFFNREDDRCNKAHTLFLSLAGQLLMAKPSLFRYISDLPLDFYKSPGPGQKLYIDQAKSWNLLKAIFSCPGGRSVICVINAIQECQYGIRPFLTDLVALADTAETQFKVIISSTFQAGEFPGSQKSCHEISLDNEENMHSQALERIEDSLSKLVQNKPALRTFKKDIAAQVCQSETLNFLQASLSLKYLETARVQSTPFSVQSMLRSLSQTTPEMAVQHAINNSDPSIRQWTLDILAWVSYSFRPLRLEELATAMALKDWKKTPDPVDDYLARDIATDLTQALGTVLCIQNNEVRFGHPSIRDAVRAHVERENTPHKPESISHQNIAQLCVSYLSIDRMRKTLEALRDTSDDAETSVSDSKQYSEKHGLVLYAVQYWPAHYRQVDDPSEEDTGRVTESLEKKEWVQIWLEIDREMKRPVLDLPASADSLIHLGAYLGFKDVLESKMKACQGLADNPEGKLGILKIAAREDRLPVVQYLLDNLHYEPEDVSLALIEAMAGDATTVVPELIKLLKVQPEHSSTGPLLEKAALTGHTGLVEQIIKSDEHQKITPLDLFKALSTAAAVGNEAIVEFLLTSKRLAWSDEHVLWVEDTFTPLHHAVLNGHQRVVDMLICNGEPIDSRDGSSRTPLHLASMVGYPQIVSRLITGTKADVKTEVNAQDNGGRTPLHYAASYGYDKVTTLLLAANANFNDGDNDEETPLHLAARERRSTVVEQLLKAGANAVLENKKGETALHVAVAAESLSVVESLVKARSNSASLDITDSAGLTPLLLAARQGSAAIFEVLVRNDADINRTDSKRSTALHWASKRRHQAIAEALLQRGADPDAADNSDLKPIHHAAKGGDIAMLRTLLDGGADIESKTPRDKTPLLIAVEEGNRDSVEFLISRGANTDMSDWIGVTPVEHAIGAKNVEIFKILLDSASGEGSGDSDLLDRLLHKAVLGTNPEIVKLLLDKGADKNSKDGDGDSVIVNAMYGHSVQVAKILIEAGADINTTTSRWTPLQFTIFRNQTDLLRLLVDNGADIESSHGILGTPLHTASAFANLEAVGLLLKKGVNVNAIGGDHESPLYSAVSHWQQSSFEVIGLLMSRGANPRHRGGRWGNALNAAVVLDSPLASEATECLFKYGVSLQESDDQGRTALHIAAVVGNLDLLKDFLEREPDGLTRKDKQGRTILHHAAARGRQDVVSYILGMKDTATCHDPDDDGWTPLHWACRGENEEVVRLLLEKGANRFRVSKNHWTANHVAIFHGQSDLLSRSQQPRQEKEKAGEQDESGREDGVEESMLLFAEGLPLRSGKFEWYGCDGCECVSTPCIITSATTLTCKEHIWPNIPLHRLCGI